MSPRSSSRRRTAVDWGEQSSSPQTPLAINVLPFNHANDSAEALSPCTVVRALRAPHFYEQMLLTIPKNRGWSALPRAPYDFLGSSICVARRDFRAVRGCRTGGNNVRGVAALSFYYVAAFCLLFRAGGRGPRARVHLKDCAACCTRIISVGVGRAYLLPGQAVAKTTTTNFPALTGHGPVRLRRT